MLGLRKYHKYLMTRHDHNFKCVSSRLVWFQSILTISLMFCRVIFHVASTACYWFDILLIIILALLPRFMIKVAKQRFRPADVDVAREEEVLKSNVMSRR